MSYAAPRPRFADALALLAGTILQTDLELAGPEQIARQIWRAVVSDQDCLDAAAPEKILAMIQRLVPRVIG